MDSKPHEPTASPPRPTYATPRLVVYGALAALTETVGATGMNDMSGPRKTGY